ncbi:methylmalonyl Co-A mutase-associated GTPase MeaB [Marinobacter salarius]|jgi:LAO/AO transport system kinase|uniref:methylmalonyl Co-A mutase-associated GTPase MeaB n=1 Tax=Marinobacter salarius TaxID=1420917 RepID=UPI0032EB0F89|tara:strand:+ start:2883 stop:3827 length:945 start_codon:yes stop_codon:yes gene_type:complete
MNARPEPSSLIERLFAGEAAALARAISLVENEASAAQDILKMTQPKLGRAMLVGFTGSPGVGKSSLVNAYIRELRARGKTVGVVAVDPSSPLTRGAILGDRIRITDCAADPDVFIRSLAARGNVGGLSPAAARVVDVMDAAGKDVVILETVGAGQSEVEVAEVAHVKIVVSAPGLGDGVQAIKSGILEIADILVVNKADLPGADHTQDQLRRMLKLRRTELPSVPLLPTCASTGEGIAVLADAVEACFKANSRAGRVDPLLRARRVLANSAAAAAKRWVIESDDPRMIALSEALQRGELGADEAARSLLEMTYD